jgi:hypothetical protein
MQLTAPPRIGHLARAYSSSHQNLRALQKRHGLSVSDLAEPDRVFQALLTGRACPLRQLLSDPETRRTIRETLSEQINP